MAEGSPSAGWREVADEMDVEAGLPEYLEENRDDLEELAEEEYPVSRVIHGLLDRHDRGEIEC